MSTIGLVGAGEMGSALGASWREGGSEVRTCLAGRSERTHALAEGAGLWLVPTLDEVAASDVVVTVVPPGAAVSAASELAAAVRRSGSQPLIVDLNAVAPSTLRRVCTALGDPADFVDGSVSGMPPRPGAARTTVYLSGPRAREVAAMANPWCRTEVLGDEVGAASALKMCTASMYKGTNALVLQAVLAASHFGVIEPFLENLSRAWPDEVPHWAYQVALAVTKSERFADEMREIAATQDQAGLVPAMFEGIAEVFVALSGSELAGATPETVDDEIVLDEVIRRLT